MQGRAAIIWPGGDEPISDDPIEVRASKMALAAIAQGAHKVWVVPKRYWKNGPAGLSKEEMARAEEEAEPMAFVAEDGTINVRAVGEGPNIQRAFQRAFERATLTNEG